MLKWTMRAAALLAIAVSAAACSTTGGSSTSSWMPAGAAAFAPAGFDSFCDSRPAECGDGGDTARPIQTAAMTADSGLVAAVSDTIAAPARMDRAIPRELRPLTILPVITIAGAPDAAPAATGNAFPPAASLVSKDADWDMIEQINDWVNGAIHGVTDLEAYGVAERWAMPLSEGGRAIGDCEDYALEKRRMLLDRGVAPDALFFAVAMHPRYGRHLVLVVSTEAGDYVLDNLTPWIVRWNDTGYDWRTRQRSALSRDWVRIEEPAPQRFVQGPADIAG